MAKRDRDSLESMLDAALRLRGIARDRSRVSVEGDDVALLAMLHLIQTSIAISCGGSRLRMWSR